MKSSSQITEHIIDCLSKNILPGQEEGIELGKVMAEDAEIAMEWEEMNQIVDAYRLANFEKSLSAYDAWEKVEANIAASEAGKGSIVRRLKYTKIGWWAAAACITAIIITIAGLYKIQKKPVELADSKAIVIPKYQFAKTYIKLLDGKIIFLQDNQSEIRINATEGSLTDGSGNIIASGAAIGTTAELVVPAGRSCKVYLPDNSVVTLNSASVLSFPVQFSGAERLVALKGEGLFKVTKNSRQPFIVATNNMRVKVLGTVFTVKAYPGEQEQATLISGSVIVSSAIPNVKKQVKLVPGETVAVKDSNMQVNNSTLQDKQEPTWVAGTYQFNKEPLKNIISILERWYDVKITVEASLLNEHVFTGAVEHKNSLNYFLDMLAVTSSDSIHYKVDGKNITIY